MTNEKAKLTPLWAISQKYKMHPRTASSRLERYGYEGVVCGSVVCFAIDEKADEILKVPVKHRKNRRVLVQQELPLPTTETQAENRQEAREVEINEKVAVALAVELPNVSITVKAN